MARLYTVTCEYDIGLNFTGNSGVYSSSRAREEAVTAGLEVLKYEIGDKNSLEESGLLSYETIEG